MKRCQYCAEEIQDAALVCKHCGKNVSAPGADRGTPRRARQLAIGVSVLAIIGIALAAVSQSRKRAAEDATEAHADSVSAALSHARADSLVARARADSASAQAVRARADSAEAAKLAAAPHYFPIADEDAIDIPAAASRPFRFVLAPDKGNCTVVGNVRGLAGGNRDVEVMLFTDDQYVESKANPTRADAQATLAKSANHQLDFQLYGSGTYYLVVSNDFSALTPKTVQVKAQLRCVAGSPPRIME